MRERWEIMLISEAGGRGEYGNLVRSKENEYAVFHEMNSGVKRREKTSRLRVGKKEQKWFGEQVTTVHLGGVRLIVVFQTFKGMYEEDMERCRQEVESQLAFLVREKLMILEDSKARVKKDSGRRGICRNY